VRAFLVRLSRDYNLADDLAQETFLTAFQKIDLYRGTGSFSAWLFQVAYNKFLEQKRRDKRRDEINKQMQSDFEPQADRYQSMNDVQYDLEAAMAKISPEQAAAITLCHSYGYSHREAAEILDMPVGTVKTHIARGKELLRSQLGTDFQLGETG
ncbi:MAG: RNA polymerase sigma factor, partial [Gammaproteobacteria bacterium]